ncbi:monocarboxylate transporter 13 isoform X1 [Ictalurus furcatus]|uniref:monocarboxylate transporter 13 isoform X1 n=1 Tax=Ictalurus furcatus TaxID=66913 RepID=UPI00235028EB|nr:monocarboxylate transporter 13 isoform X1 [Ictalurus furcatus]XP_053485253.1 monocarboxylate transporter 13 isoform X1 [Ictalurus furcatus]XP_053485254.1 monocarboxylate transporter 13 isoform X1 [Ictalurus furcatus]
MAMQQEKKHQPVGDVEAPDGGWGWAVVVALFMASALVFGLIRSLGVFFVEFVQYFGESAQAVSWITSIGVAMQQLLSPIGTAACNAYGARRVVMIGGVLSGLGFMLASQATTLTHLYLTMGLISGSGWALVFTPTIASVMEYFSTRRALAMGLGFTGVGLSSFVFSPLFQYLVDFYGWRGALLILGGLSFNIVGSGALIRPLRPIKVVEMSKSNSVSDNCRSFFSRSCEYFELSLLLHRGFIIYSLAVTCFNAGYFIPYVHLVAHSRLVGFSEFQAAFVISSTGVTDILGRVVSGWASDLRHLRSLHLLTIWTALVGLFLLLLPLCSLQGHYSGLLTVSLAYGFCAGAMTPLVFSVVPEIVGMDRMVGALGLLQLIESVGGLLGAPLSGWLKDLTGSYVFSFVVASVFLFLGTIITMTLPYFCTCTNPPPLSPKKKTKNESTEADPLKQVLPVDSIENIQNPDRIPETLPSQNHLTETSLEVKDAPLSANWTGSEATC